MQTCTMHVDNFQRCYLCKKQSLQERFTTSQSLFDTIVYYFVLVGSYLGLVVHYLVLTGYEYYLALIGDQFILMGD